MPVVVVGATLAFQDDGSDLSRPRRLESGSFEPIDGASRAPGSLPPIVRILLRERVEAWAPGPVRVAVGRAILGPGARVYMPDGETLFVAVDSGTLELTGAGERTVAVGEGLMELPGPDRALRNAGSGLLALLILTVTPVAE